MEFTWRSCPLHYRFVTLGISSEFIINYLNSFWLITGVVFSGAEAMFADLGHFSNLSIRVRSLFSGNIVSGHYNDD